MKKISFRTVLTSESGGWFGAGPPPPLPGVVVRLVAGPPERDEVFDDCIMVDSWVVGVAVYVGFYR